MAKWSGVIAYKGELKETSPGIYDYEIKEYRARGTINGDRSVTNQNDNESINTDTTFNSYVDIVASPFCLSQIHNMLYLTVAGVKWRIRSVTPMGNRLRLNLGEVYKL